MDIYTIGHSTLPLDKFIDILKKNNIKCLVDVRSYPGSSKFPHFNKAKFKKNLEGNNITYYHIPELGGRRRKISNIHTSIKLDSFAGYADHMLTEEFNKGMKELKKIARKCKTAYMCSESLYWKCHRRMISDKLVFEGWNVYHLGISKNDIKHEPWQIAKLVNGKIYYNN